MSIIGGANIHIFVFKDLNNNRFQNKLMRQTSPLQLSTLAMLLSMYLNNPINFAFSRSHLVMTPFCNRFRLLHYLPYDVKLLQPKSFEYFPKAIHLYCYEYWPWLEFEIRHLYVVPFKRQTWRYNIHFLSFHSISVVSEYETDDFNIMISQLLTGFSATH